MKDKKNNRIDGWSFQRGWKYLAVIGAAIAEALESKGYNAQTLELNPRTVLKDIEDLRWRGCIQCNSWSLRRRWCIARLIRNG